METKNKPINNHDMEHLEDELYEVKVVVNKLCKDMIAVYKLLLSKGVISKSDVELVGTQALFNIIFNLNPKERKIIDD